MLALSRQQALKEMNKIYEVMDAIEEEFDRLENKELVEGLENMTEEERGQLKLLRHLTNLL